MSIWNQAAQEGSWHHWDATTIRSTSATTARRSAPVSSGPAEFRFCRLERIKQWLMYHPPPRTRFPIEWSWPPPEADLRKALCVLHDSSGEHFGTVTPLAKIGTDPQRSLAFDKAMPIA